MTTAPYRRPKLLAMACASLSIILVFAFALLTAPARAQTNTPGTTHYKSSEWNFALDIPKGWHPFPPVATNSPAEVIRFMSGSRDDGSLIIFRSPYDPKEDLKAYSDKIQRVLTNGGFLNFVKAETTIGSKVVVTLDFDRKTPDGHTLSCRHYFVVDGTVIHTLGFGTINREAMFPVFDQMAKNFAFTD